MKNTEKLVGVLISLARNWKEQSVRAVREGDGKLYLPASLNLQGFEQIRKFPQTILTGGANEKEPVYFSLGDGQKGQNADGTPHGGFIIIDVIDRTVVDLVDRNGVSILKPGDGNVTLHGDHYARGIEGWIEFFHDNEGSFVLMDNEFWPYAFPKCRCPAPQMTIFWSEDSANTKAAELNGPLNGNDSRLYQVHPINDRLYAAFRAAHAR